MYLTLTVAPHIKAGGVGDRKLTTKQEEKERDTLYSLDAKRETKGTTARRD